MDDQTRRKLEMRLVHMDAAEIQRCMTDPEIRAMIDDDVMNRSHILLSGASDGVPLYVLRWWLIHLRSSFIEARVEGFAEGLAEHAPDPEDVRRSAEKYRRELEETVWPSKDKPLKEAWAEIDDRIMDEHSLEGLQVRLDLIIERQEREKASG
jgi:hypothetical protein